MGFEGVGRVFTPEVAKVQKQAEAHRKARRHDSFARALVLEWLLLRPWQHKIATRSAYGDAKSGALPRFLIADRLDSGDQGGQSLFRVSWHKVLLHQRVSAHFAVRSTCLLGRPILDWRAGRPERGTTGTKPSALNMYGWNLPNASKGLAPRPERHTLARKCCEKGQIVKFH